MTATARERICVTGATGKAGRATVRELRAAGYDVLATDAVLGADDVAAGVLRADLTDYGQATEVLRGVDGVVHLANIPAPGRTTPAVTFNDNVAMNFNVFHAAAALGLTRVVWASSETTLGLPFGHGAEQVPGAPGALRYAPVDEDHFPLPATSYGLSKVVSETIAEQIARWSGIGFVGLRISNIMEPHDYQRFPSYWPDSHARKWNLWGYVDVRDVAAACRLGLEADVTGSLNVIIAAADTVMNRPSRDVLAEVFPDLPLTREIGEFDTLLAIDRAKRLLGYEPRHSWRDELARLRMPKGLRPPRQAKARLAPGQAFCKAAVPEATCASQLVSAELQQPPGRLLPGRSADGNLPGEGVAGRLDQRAVLIECSFRAAKQDHHQDVKQRARGRLGHRGKHVFDDHQRAAGTCRPRAVRNDPADVLIVPVVQHLAEQVQVTLGDIGEEVPRCQVRAVRDARGGQEARRSGERFRPVEQHSRGLGHRPQEPGQHGSPASAHVDYARGGRRTVAGRRQAREQTGGGIAHGARELDRVPGMAAEVIPNAAGRRRINVPSAAHVVGKPAHGGHHRRQPEACHVRDGTGPGSEPAPHFCKGEPSSGIRGCQSYRDPRPQ
jgi:nucleoside-diphosphate-sugar epimerase